MYNVNKFEKTCISLTSYTSNNLDVYMKDLNFGKDEIMLDVGCGQGYTTLNTLLPKIKPHLKHLVAVDINTEMLEVARNKYSHPLITYKELDFSKPVTEYIKKQLLPQDCVSNGFDKIFSSYCIMTIQDQRRVAKNFSLLLKPGGEVIIVICSKSVDDEIRRDLAKIPKWKPYMEDVEEYISVYQDSEDPSKEVCSYLENEGFKIIGCKSEKFSLECSTWEEFADIHAGFNMLMSRIPENDVGKYMEDCMELIKRKSGSNKPCYDWECLIVHAMKPL